MAVLVRLILAFGIFCQSALGVTSGTCAAAPIAADCAPAAANCGCCQDGDGNPIACPMAANPSIGCNCSAAHDAEPAPPPADSTSKQLPRLVALPIAFPPSGLFAPTACGSWRERTSAATSRPGHCIHSILCVWLT